MQIRGFSTLEEIEKAFNVKIENTEKALNELRQHTDFIFQMDADVGPSGGDNSGKYFDQYSIMTKALDQFEMV